MIYKKKILKITLSRIEDRESRTEVGKPGKKLLK